MINKYNISISEEVLESNRLRLIKQIWKLIPMRQKNEDYIKQLDSVLIEVAGLSEMFKDDINFLLLQSKLEGLRVKCQEIDFFIYRKIVFDCIGILKRFM